LNAAPSPDAPLEFEKESLAKRKQTLSHSKTHLAVWVQKLLLFLALDPLAFQLELFPVSQVRLGLALLPKVSAQISSLF
jgi:hypothetical protein